MRLPVGTVTLLLADVEGSTRLWESEPEAMTDAMRHLDQVLAGLIEQHRGARPVEQGEGDSFVVAFTRASDAVGCALGLQRADLGPIRLRIGLHTGEVQLRDEGNYVGPAINRCARLRNLGHGGQTVLSTATHDLVADHLPDDAWVLDLGVHGLRDLDRPEHVHQLCHKELVNEFPALRSVSSYTTTLPMQLASFIGREAELADVHGLLARHRLVTLTGAGGCGKTRLAIEVAGAMLDAYADGVPQIDLSSLVDADLVANQAARAFRLPDEAGATPLETLVRHLADKQVLLIVDNCEHLIAASSTLVVTVLRACPGVSVLATSREALGVAGEVAYRIPSMALDSDAVELFVERAQRARPSFSLDDSNRDAVLEICRRLDGIPLALELAAARIRAFSPGDIVQGLHDRFRLLTGGARGAVQRQHTLRASVDWSHHLLTEPERILFRRLAVFVGSFTLDAAEAVCAGEGLERHHVMDQLASLVDKSLVGVDDVDGTTRYSTLETVRQYALEQLATTGEADHLRARHLEHFLDFAAGRFDPFQTGGDPSDRSALVAELDNLRAAFHWAVDMDRFEDALRLPVMLTMVWILPDRLHEGRAWFDAALPKRDAVNPLVRGWALGASATLETRALGSEAIPRATECLAIARDIADPASLALALSVAGWAQSETGDSDDGVRLLAEACDLARSTGNAFLSQLALGSLANATSWDDAHRARRLIDECLAAVPGTPPYASGNAAYAAHVAVWEGNPSDGLEVAERVLRTEAWATEWSGRVLAITAIAWAQALRGERQAAMHAAEEALAGSAALGALWGGWAHTSIGFAHLAAGDGARAAGYLREAARSAGPRHRFLVAGLLADAELACGNVAAALATADDALARMPDGRPVQCFGWVVHARARVALAEDRLDEGEAFARRAVDARHRYGDPLTTADSLELLAAVLARRGAVTDAVRLIGAAESARARAGAVRLEIYRSQHEATVACASAALTADELAAALDEGRGLSIDAAVGFAQRGRGERKRPATGWESLTPTELDVVGLVAQGLANKEIAQKLLVSPRTVQAHLTHVYAKLGFTSRVQLATEAAARP